MRTLVFAGLLAISGVAHASCECTCVNGQVQALCTSTLDLKPICSPQVCPIVPPAVTPITPPTLPPLGTSSCEMKQVLNPNTGLYEWRKICH